MEDGFIITNIYLDTDIEIPPEHEVIMSFRINGVNSPDSIHTFKLDSQKLKIPPPSNAQDLSEQDLQKIVPVLPLIKQMLTELLYSPPEPFKSVHDHKGNVLILDLVIGNHDGKVVEKTSSIDLLYHGTVIEGNQFILVKSVPERIDLTDTKHPLGWHCGLLGMKIGGRRLIIVPPELAYLDYDDATFLHFHWKRGTVSSGKDIDWDVVANLVDAGSDVNIGSSTDSNGGSGVGLNAGSDVNLYAGSDANSNTGSDVDLDGPMQHRLST
ncbi:hypothetical protein Clacol_005116 [Clathrus columnatus]|uniref:peptidylprolyl isomerase n=1 Tax=Clathrus columnatus TaxID=1419009 RepID=A0AAV5ADZ4_9AGAM|nr:hypothetical protein Clacol_005116 [Clathrus columnatus]